MSIVTDFRSIARKVNRMDQKAEFEKNNPVPEFCFAALASIPVVVADPDLDLPDWLTFRI